MSAASQFFGSNKSLIATEVLVVGGGGPGGGPIAPNPFGYVTAYGGGGAGQVVHSYLELQQGVTYPVTVGAGGGDSIFHTIRSASGQAAPAGGAFSGFSSAAGSDGTTSPTAGTTFGEILSVSQSGVSYSGANAGGAGAYNPNGFQAAGGGGGGATTAGTNAPSATTPGTGGAGYTVNVTGISSTYGAGGPGGPGSSGASNTGNGGGGAYSGGGAPAGGSGIVIIAYPTAFPAATSVTGTYSTPSRSGYRVYQFTGSGSITI
jgi:hypothetical protein